MLLNAVYSSSTFPENIYIFILARSSVVVHKGRKMLAYNASNLA